MIRVLLADDHKLVKDGLRALISTEVDIKIVGDCENGSQVLTLLDQLPVDIILMDISMPGMDGIRSTELIRTKHPNVRVIALSMHNEPSFIKKMLKAGASGYLFKNCNKTELIEAIRQVYTGNPYYGKAVTSAMMSDL